MWWIPEGSKYVLGIVALAFIVFTIARFTLKPELPTQSRQMKVITGILWVFVIYSSFVYITDGDSWKQLKALITAALFSLIYRNVFYKKEWINATIFVSGSGLVILSWTLFLIGERRVGGFINPIPYATAIAAMMLICFVFGLYEKKKLERNVFKILSALLFSALLLTQTRGVIIPATFLLIFIYLIYALSSKGVVKTLAGAIAIAVLAGAATFLMSNDRIERTLQEVVMISDNNYESSIGLRLIMWDAAIEIWKSAPITGLGDTHLDTLNNLLDQKRVHPHFHDFTPSHYHNQYLNELVTKGLIGLVLFSTLIFSVFCLARKNESPQLRLASLSIMALYLLASLSDVPFKQPETILLFFVAIFVLSNFGPQTECRTESLS